MLKLLNNQPYITLDPFIDIQGFLDLHDEFNFIIASNQDKIRTGIWSAGGHSPGHNKIFHENDLLYYVHQRAQLERQTNKDLHKKLTYFEEKNDRAGLAKFYKVKYNAMDPYNILNLRTTTKDVYSSDAHFTKEDWKCYSWIDLIDSYPKIKVWIESLPLDELGIVTIFYNEHYVPLGYHRDFNYFPLEKGDQTASYPHRQEFIWLRFNLDRQFCLFDIEDDKIIETIDVKGYSAFFNHHNWHGNFQPISYSSLTVKVEGKFSNELRKQLGIHNLEYY